MSNLRTRNRLPHNFIDGIAIQGINVTHLKDISSHIGSTLVGHGENTVEYEINSLYNAAQGLLDNINSLSNSYNTLNGEVVKITGNQTVAGTKTFSSTIAGNINGNAETATKLATARTIGGVSFDGSANINLPSASTEASGIVRIANLLQAQTGTNNEVAMTPATVEHHMTVKMLGWGQTWQNVTGSRAINVEYQNVTGRPILIVIFGRASGDRLFEVKGSNVGATYETVSLFTTLGEPITSITVLVPPDNYYRFRADDANISNWAELR
jgi:hypothetical protein